MIWDKKGIVFNKHHAQLPTGLRLGDVLRVFYSTKDHNRSVIRAFDVALDNPLKIVRDDFAVLGLGNRGCFDDSGVMPSSVVQFDGLYYLYYTGWSLRQSVPYSHAIGVAVSEDGYTFRRNKTGPILDRNVHDAYLVNSGVVIGNAMYYCSGNGWDGNFPSYHISVAYYNGIWNPTGKIIVGNKGEAVSRVSFHNNRMWFAAKRKHTSYVLEYFENNERHMCDIRSQGWDEEMTCYPFIYDKYMLYNGNGYGASGIGLAEWKE